ncbi:MAG: zinc ribbon protein [Gemmataceae bacterium]|nr:zinc ribbon protein [Gemmataceae bacterium]
MPLYEYRCRTCEHAFEALVAARGGEEVRCQRCDGTELDRLLGLPARGRTADPDPGTNCRGDGPPCGAPWCGREG